jgi:hypothetical protein
VVRNPGGPVFDPAGQSLAHLKEVLFACLEARGAKSVIEVGARAGELTRELVGRASGRGGGVVAVEPAPEQELVELDRARPELALVREPSLNALRHLPPADAVIVDGDHNYYTVSAELRLIAERAGDVKLPLILLHDVGWPHGRRDTYYAPERIPERERQPLAEHATLAPGEPGLAHGGLRYRWAASREGGPRNGVLTAVEDFVERLDGLRVAIVPAFFGLAVLWRGDAAWADAVSQAVTRWDRDPVLDRMEAHRIANLVGRNRHAQELEEIEAMRLERERHTEQERLLRTMLGSRAFAWAERLSRLRQGGRPTFSRAEVKRSLGR